MNNCPICKSNEIIYSFSSSDITYYTTSEVFTLYRCKICGAVFINPLLSEEQLKKYYKTNYLPYTKPAVKRTHHTDFLLKKFDKYKEFSLLDLACGSGNFLWLVRKLFPNSNLVGVDMNSPNIKSKDFVFIKSSVYNLDLRTKFDVIVANSILEHLSKPHDFLKTLNKNSKEGTLVLLYLPNAASYTAEKYDRYWIGFDVPRHQINYTPKALEILMSHFFDTVNIKYYGSYAINTSSKYLSEGKNIHKESYFWLGIINKFISKKYTVGDMLWIGKRK